MSCINHKPVNHFNKMLTISCITLSDNLLKTPYLLITVKPKTDRANNSSHVCVWLAPAGCILYTKKSVLKRCPWGTILENRAFFGKKGTILRTILLFQCHIFFSLCFGIPYGFSSTWSKVKSKLI